MSPQSATIWSAESKAVLDDVKAGIVSRATRIREDIDRLIKSSLDSNYLQRMHKELSVDWETSIDPSTIQESKTYESKEQDRHELRQQWEQTVKELGIIEKQIVAIFVILAANDKEPKYEDNNALRIALQLAWREKNKPLYNTGMTAVLVGFVVCFVIVFFLTSAVEYYATHSISRALKDGVYVGLYTALALVLQFGSALIVALSIRYSWVISLKYTNWTPGSFFPVSQSAALLSYCAICAAAMNIIVYILFQLISGNLTPQEALNSKALPMEVLFRLFGSLVPGLFAVGCTVIADFTEQGKDSWRPIVGFSLTICVVSFVLLMLNENYAITKRPFWTDWASGVAFSIVGLLVFRLGAFSVRRSEGDGPYLG
jgi:hypothetical protein